MELIDTHCHLNHAAFDADRVAVQTRARAAGVAQMLCISYDLVSSRRAAALANTEPGLYAAIGIHPESAQEWDEAARAELRALYHSSPARMTAYGEIGLDYHWETIPRAAQQTVFAEQIAFAATLSPLLPLIIHCRDAFDDTLAVLRDSHTQNPVVMHCFGGDLAAAEACLNAGYYLGIGGVATFKKSDALRTALVSVPLERLLLETDCPYLAPQPWRGKRNEPSYLLAVAQTLAAVKNVSIETIAVVITLVAISSVSIQRTLFFWPLAII